MHQTNNDNHNTKLRDIELRAEYQGELSHLHALLRKLSSDWEQENERCSILFKHDPDAPYSWPFELALRPGEPSIADWSVGYKLNSSNEPYPVGGVHAWQVREKGVHVIFTAHTSEAWRLIGPFYAEIIGKGHMTTDPLVIYPQQDVQVGEAAQVDSQLQSTSQLPPRGKPGRKPLPAYEKAYRRIRNGEPEEQVYADCCAELQIVLPDAATREAFKKAMDRHRRKADVIRRN